MSGLVRFFRSRLREKTATSRQRGDLRENLSCIPMRQDGASLQLVRLSNCRSHKANGRAYSWSSSSICSLPNPNGCHGSSLQVNEGLPCWESSQIIHEECAQILAISQSIISDCDPWFTGWFWLKFSSYQVKLELLHEFAYLNRWSDKEDERALWALFAALCKFHWKGLC